MAFAVLVFGYALMYAGMTGYLSLLSGGKIPKVSVLAALGVTGASGLLTSGTGALNPFASAAALSTGVTGGTLSTALVPASIAPQAYLSGTGSAAPSPISGAQALGSGVAA